MESNHKKGKSHDTIVAITIIIVALIFGSLGVWSKNRSEVAFTGGTPAPTPPATGVPPRTSGVGGRGGNGINTTIGAGAPLTASAIEAELDVMDLDTLDSGM